MNTSKKEQIKQVLRSFWFIVAWFLGVSLIMAAIGIKGELAVMAGYILSGVISFSAMLYHWAHQEERAQNAEITLMIAIVCIIMGHIEPMKTSINQVQDNLVEWTVQIQSGLPIIFIVFILPAAIVVVPLYCIYTTGAMNTQRAKSAGKTFALIAPTVPLVWIITSTVEGLL